MKRCSGRIRRANRSRQGGGGATEIELAAAGSLRRPFAMQLRFLLVASLALAGFSSRAAESGLDSAARIPDISQRIGCSTLAQAKQTTEVAFRNLAGIGCEWLDLSCLNWAPHVSVPKLTEDFEKEARRVEALLTANHLRVANLTFDAPDSRSFDQYFPQWEAVVKLAARLKARLINVMAPSAKMKREDAAVMLKKMQEVAVQSGVILTIETHVGQITERPADALWLCQQVPGLGLTLDPSHYYAGPNQGAKFEVLYPYVQGTGFRAGGMKWESIQLPWGEGPIDFPEVVRKLEAVGYKGFYVSEYIEGHNQVDALKESKRFLEWAKRLSERGAKAGR